MVKKNQEQPRFRVGDRVRVRIGSGKAPGVVAEDRGNFGKDGQRLYFVDTFVDPDIIQPVPRSEDELEPDVEQEPTLDHDQIIAYLKRPALYAILMNNSPGGRNQPQVWLTRNSLGDVTYTFLPERGGLGGATVPYWALDGHGKVRPEKKEEVIAFLSSFGLNREEAEDVIQNAWNGS